MGYMRHHAIVVTSYDEKQIAQAHSKASSLGCNPSEIKEAKVNGYGSFFVPPDGSKEGWTESDDGDDRRTAFVDWLDAQRFEDGSTSLDWVEVQYGDDNRHTAIIRHSDE